ILEDDAATEIVLSQEKQMRGSGVAGVPAFLVNQQLFVSGAHETDVLVGMFDRAMFGDAELDDEQVERH
ncbi:MAG: DsbA family protein, partial [Pseudomonadota bacterium]